MDENQVQFLPWHAINEFMQNEYRLSVIRTTLNTLPSLPADYRLRIEQVTNKEVKIPGFRNSSKAPLQIRVIPTANAFQKSSFMTVAILAAWAQAHPELRTRVHELLISRGWDVLPPEADRTQLPGFQPSWPKDESFDVLNSAFSEKYPDYLAESNDVSLMIVWMSDCLPYNSVEDSEEDNPEK